MIESDGSVFSSVYLSSLSSPSNFKHPVTLTSCGMLPIFITTTSTRPANALDDAESNPDLPPSPPDDDEVNDDGCHVFDVEGTSSARLDSARVK